jgi:hypothetical protein
MLQISLFDHLLLSVFFRKFRDHSSVVAGQLHLVDVVGFVFFETPSQLVFDTYGKRFF